MNAQRNAKEHLLRTLRDGSVHSKQVRALERLKSEVVVTKVAVVNHRRIQELRILFDQLHHVVGDEWRSLVRPGVDVLVHGTHRLGERLVGVFVQVANRDTGCELRKIRVAHGHRSGNLRRKAVQFARGNSVVQAFNHAKCNGHRVYQRTQAVAELLDTGGNLVEFDGFLAAVALDNVHHVRIRLEI